MKVHKYYIPFRDEFHLLLPQDAKILSFQVQKRNLFIWCLIDEIMPVLSRKFILVVTGNEISIPEFKLFYIDTIQDGEFVWHLFEVIE